MSLFAALALIPLSIDDPLPVRLLNPSPAVDAVTEIHVDGDASDGNPFDPDVIAVDAHVQRPSGGQYTVPGFLYRPFERKLVDGKEVDTPTGPPEWRVRICPTEAGTYRLVVTRRDRKRRQSSRVLTFQVSSRSGRRGIVTLSPIDRRFFARDGKPYFPIGANVAWGDDRKSFAYDDWLPKFGAAGADYARVWLGPSWSSFAIESPESGFGRFDLGNAYRLDHVLELAQQHRIDLMLCIDSYNTLRDQDAYPAWLASPYNRANGGPLDQPAEFWTNAEARKRYKDKLRYLVARYGAYTSVFAWEFWNEVDLTRGFTPETARTWHEEMAKTLRAMDPYRHLVTTSFSSSPGYKAVDSLPGLDLVQTHLYSPNLVREAAVLHREKPGKAHFIGEVGADGGGPRQEDREGVQVHDALWVSIGCGMSGTAMSWWWDNLIAPNNLYPLYRPVAKFVRDIDWPSERFVATEPELTFRDHTQKTARGDLEFVDGPARFGEAAYNRPVTVRLVDGKATGDLPLASIQHGTHNHPELHNPVTFEMSLTKPTTLDVIVGDVSGYGGAKLRVTLDGKTAIDRDFADADSGTESLRQYSGSYSVDIPSGAHRVVVENLGNDWFVVGYRFRGLSTGPRPPLDVYAVRGRNTALAWLQVKGRSWRNVVELANPPAPSPATTVRFADLPKGRWMVEVWDTWTGHIVDRLTTNSDGRTTTPIPLEPITKDLALKLRRLPR